MMRGAIYAVIVLLVSGALIWIYPGTAPAPAKTETLSCVRVKQMTPAGAINYLCEVRK